MRLPMLLIHALVLTAIGSAQSHQYRVLASGKPVGTATISVAVTPSGLKVSQTLKITSSGQSVTVVSEESYDRQGVSQRQSMKLSGPSGNMTSVCTFSAKGANLRIQSPQGEQNRVFAYQGKNGRKDASVWWFVRDTPKVGQKIQFDDFDMERQTWGVTTTVYRGRQTVKIGSRSFNAHLIEQTDSSGNMKAYVDDKGNLLRLISPNLVVERIVS